MGDSAGGQGTKRLGWWRFLVGFGLSVLTGAAMGWLAGSLVGGGGGGASPAETGELSPQGADIAGDESADGSGGGLGEPDPADNNPYAGFRVGDFDLIDRDGEPVDETLFNGEVTVLTFFFTSCNGPCPAIARVMKGLQDRTADGAGAPLRFASISVDGGRDTPEVISAFADAYGARRSRWSFMTGDPGAVRDLVRESIGCELREEYGVQVEDPSGAMMNNILHPTRLLLVGPDRRLIGVYAFNDAERVEALVMDALEALE